MRYIKFAGALLACLAFTATSAVAAQRPAYERAYLKRFAELVHRHGKQTAGCELIGSRYTNNCHGPATKARVLKSNATIKRMLYVPPPPPPPAPSPTPAASAPAPTSQGTPSTTASTSAPATTATTATPTPTSSSSAGNTASGTGTVPSGYSTPPESIAQCESGGDPTTNTGNGFYGKWQFTQQTWHAVTGLPGNASDYPESVQDQAAAKLYAGGAGAGNWPVCSQR